MTPVGYARGCMHMYARGRGRSANAHADADAGTATCVCANRADADAGTGASDDPCSLLVTVIHEWYGPVRESSCQFTRNSCKFGRNSDLIQRLNSDLIRAEFSEVHKISFNSCSIR